MLRLLRRSWWVIVGTFVLAVAVAALSLVGTAPVYEAEVLLSFVPTRLQESGEIVAALSLLDGGFISTFVEVIGSPAEVGKATRKAGISPEALATASVTVGDLAPAHIVRIAARAPSPELAHDLVLAVAESGSDKVRSAYRVFRAERLAAPTARLLGPTLLRSLSLAGGFGLALGIVAALLRERGPALSQERGAA